MGEKTMRETAPPDERGGYLTSALIFAAITALWALIVRDDPYYRLNDLFGFRVPAILLAYLFFMPLFGFFIGSWRYNAPHRGAVAGRIAKLLARAIQFTYVHLLIVLFTVAMATDIWLGLNIDDQIRSLDDRLFDVAARFAPWLAAYLTGFNLGRALRLGNRAQVGARDAAADFVAMEHRAATSKKSRRAEPPVEDRAFIPSDHAGVGDLGQLEPAPGKAARVTSSGLYAAAKPGANSGEGAAPEEQGFLPPQDLNRLRPKLGQLR